MDLYNQIMYIVGITLGILSFYNIVYLVIGFFSKGVFYPETDVKKKYGIIIPARNEAAVIGKLIDSIKKQSYDASLIKIFVVADNCSDDTAKIARELGAIVYERNEPNKARKGYALNFVFNKIKEDYGILDLDGYFIFDADNLLDPNYITEMNKAFVVNPNVITSYRNTKNFDTNIISAAYGIHFYRSTMAYHRPRSLLKVGTHLAGTGYLIASNILKDGWKYHELTEDTEFTIELASKNIKVGFCQTAIFYDEQPTNFFVSCRQRIRWAKGRINVFFKKGHKLLINLFRKPDFTFYDLLYYLTPWDILNLTRRMVTITIGVIAAIKTNDILTSIAAVLLAELIVTGGNILINLFWATFVVIREKSQINCSKTKLIFYIIAYPWFTLVNGVITIIALLKPNVKWKPIIHKDDRVIDDLIKVT